MPNKKGFKMILRTYWNKPGSCVKCGRKTPSMVKIIDYEEKSVYTGYLCFRCYKEKMEGTLNKYDRISK